MKRKTLFFTIIVLLNTIGAIAQSGITGDLRWELSSGTLTLSGEGAIPDYEFMTEAPWFEFARDKLINTIVIESGVTGIGDYAFYACESLTSILIPNGVVNIGGGVFYGCTSLISIEVENENENYSSENGVLFNKNKTNLIYCPGGKTGEYIIPNSVTTIEYFAFCSCKNLTLITIPNSVISIQHGAFSDCISLTSITIPNSVIEIGLEVFCRCTSLTSIEVGSENSKYTSKDGVLFNKKERILVRCPEGKIGKYVIPNNVKGIGIEAFFNCTNLTSIDIPNSVVDIGNGAFSCSNITSLTIPKRVSRISKGAFMACVNLSSVTIPKSVTSIGSDAFAYCNNLVLITNHNPKPIVINSNVFFDIKTVTNSNVFYDLQHPCTLRVPEKAISVYKNTDVWKNFNIEKIKDRKK